VAKRLTEAGGNGPPVVDPETERNFMRKIISAQQDIDTYVAIKRNVLKAAQKAGCNTKAMQKAITAKDNLTLPDAVQDIKDYIRHLAQLNMPVMQVELFGESAEQQISEQRTQDERTWDAGQAGYNAGKAGRAIDECPHLQGTEEDAEWRRQWHRGQEHLGMTTLGKPSETTPANDQRQRRGSGGTRGRRGASASGLTPNTPEDVREAVAEDDAAETETEE